MAGLLGTELEISIEIEESEESDFDEAENAKTIKYMEDAQMYGPKDPSKPNSEFWRDLANHWRSYPLCESKRLSFLCSLCSSFKGSSGWCALSAGFTHTLWSLASSLLLFNAVTLFCNVLVESRHGLPL